MQLMIDYARADEIKEIFGEVLRENATMLAMCKELGFATIANAEDPRLVVARLTL
jgi:acetyltransferase